MSTTIGQYPASGQNLVLIVANDGTVLYTNESGKILLQEWGVEVGVKLPASIKDFVQRVISLNSPEKMEVKMGKRTYLVVFSPLPKQECVSISGFDISDQKQVEEKLRIKEKQNDVLHQIGKIALEYDSLQAFLDESVKLISGIPDLEYCKIMELLPDGKFLMRAGTGWKPEFVGKQVVKGEDNSQAGYTLLLRTPVIVEDFEEENRFKKPEILGIHGVASGASVLIGNMEKTFGVLVVNSTKKRKFTSDDTYFLTSVAFLISQTVERKNTEKALRESKAKLSTFLEQLPVGLGLADTQGRLLVSNSIFRSFKGDIILSRSNNSWRWRAWGTDGHLLDRSEWPFERAFQGESVDPGLDFLYTTDDGREIWTRVSAVPFRNETGDIMGAVSVIEDIDKQKKAEQALKRAHDNLEEKVKERTAELENAYNSLLENELRLHEAQKIAQLGNWDWDLQTDQFYCSDEIYHIFGVDPLEIVTTYNEFLSYIDPSDRNRVNNAIQRALRGDQFSIDYKIIPPDGQCRTVFSQGEVIFDKKLTPIRMRGVLQDITERKKAEEILERMDKIHIKEIHHRIKNNLQVISSLLDLQAEKFEDSKVIEAFREGQNRIVSMSLIHEELYKGEGTDTLSFSAYLKKLTDNLFKTYNIGNSNISLSMDLEEDSFLDMDTAVPLGIIVNELVSNSFKHAFTENEEGKILIKLCREEQINEADISRFCLAISDDGKGLPDDLELEKVESLGLQLVNILVAQLDGELELKRNNGTEFIIRFTVTEKSNQESVPVS